MFGIVQHAVPLWAFGLLIIACSILASEIGGLTRRRFAPGTPKTSGNIDGYIVGAIFGLLAFMISFTFSVAINRFDSRRAWAVREATAISTAYLRASLLD